MAKSLVIVESTTKAKILSKYFGRNYQVLVSVGHLKDLRANLALTLTTTSTVLSQK
jgi:DNA topoisomerase IA